MKKILSILVFTFLGMGNLMYLQAGAAGKTIVVKAYALGEELSQSTNATTFGGGTVQVCVESPNNIATGGLGDPGYSDPVCNSSGTTATSSGRGYTENLIFTAGVRYTLSASADTESNYYFDRWTSANSLSGSSVSSDNPYIKVDDYRRGSGTYTHNFYAIFLKWRWGYGFPCTVHAIGGGTVSMDDDISSSKTTLTPTGKTYKKKDTEIVATYYAHETESVEFVGWYDNEAGTGNPIEEELELEVRYVPTSTDENNPSAITDRTYYAIFRPKLMGYTQPCEIKISGVGEISANNTDWPSSDISQTPPIGYVYQKNAEEKITISYYARTTDATYDFIGWYDENNQLVSEATTYTYSYRPTAIVSADLKCPPATGSPAPVPRS